MRPAPLASLPLLLLIPALSSAAAFAADAGGGGFIEEERDNTKKEEKKIVPVNKICAVTGKKVNDGIEAAEVTVTKDGKPAKIHIGFADNATRSNFRKADAKTRELWIEAAQSNKVIKVVNGKAELVDPEPSAK